jgi:zinc transporter ZupT
MTQKSFLSSTTNWAAVVGVLGVILPVFGFDFGTGAQEDVVAAVGASATAASLIWVVVERFRRGDLYVTKSKA